MPRVSTRPLKKDIAADLKEYFAVLIATLYKTDDIERFFQVFLTSEEKVMLMKRLMLYLMLQNGYKTSEISSILGMSRETIRIHRTSWERSDSAYIAILKRLAIRQNTKLLWKKIERLLIPLDLAMQAKSNMKARARLIKGSYD